MQMAIASDRIPSIQAGMHTMVRRQMLEWFGWMDHILDVHRSNFVFREPTAEELGQHDTALKLAIRTCHFINVLIADPDFNEPDLKTGLQVRIQQLQDAYDTFHDITLSDEEAGKILKQVFPE
jgi:hypothetical protein